MSLTGRPRTTEPRRAASEVAVAPARAPAGRPAATRLPGPPAPSGPRWQLHRRVGGRIDLQLDTHLDPHLVWDLLTQHARHGGAQRPSHWPVLLEFAAGQAEAALRAWCGLNTVQPRAALLRRALAPSLARAPNSAIHTAVLPDAALPLLLDGLDAGVLLRFERGAPCGAPPPTTEPPPELVGQDIPPELQPRRRAAAATSASGLPLLAALPSLGLGLSSTLGVIDDGCCLAHQHLRRPDGGSRLLALWDQTPEAQAAAHPHPCWQRQEQEGEPPPYGYGVEAPQAALDRLLAAHPGLGERHERQLYAALGRPGWGAPAHTHGAALLHLLASPRPGALPAADAGADASQQPLVFVQLPPAALADTTGQALAPHVVDAARYIVARSRAAASDPQSWRSTIVLGRSGSSAGPHDGSSMAELALDQLAADARVRLVLAGGHGAQDQTHAQHGVHQQAPAQWWLRLPPGVEDDSFVQIWLPPEHPIERFQLLITPPGAPVSPLLRPGCAATWGTGTELPTAGLVWVPRVAQGLHGGMLLLALAPTALRRGAAARPLAAPGLWRLELLAAGDTPAEVHAWVAHAAPPAARAANAGLAGEAPAAGPPRARFEPAGPAARQADGSHSLGSLANGQRCTVALGHVASNRRLSPQAARGPRRASAPEAPQPLCFAPSETSPHLPGLAVPGFFSGQHTRLGGSGVAAAQVARWLAENRLTDDATRRLRPAWPGGPAVPPGARCLSPEDE